MPDQWNYQQARNLEEIARQHEQQAEEARQAAQRAAEEQERQRLLEEARYAERRAQGFFNESQGHRQV